MKISFFGHSDFLEYGLKEKVIELLIKTIGDNSVEFLLVSPIEFYTNRTQIYG